MVTKCYCGHTSYCDCGPLPEENELKDWDVTLMDGLKNEPYVSDDFQIGPDGAYEHTEDMTPKEKANDILDNFWLMDKVEPMLTEEQAKQCALIAVDVILIDCGAKDWSGDEACEGKNYWQEVKYAMSDIQPYL